MWEKKERTEHDQR